MLAARPWWADSCTHRAHLVPGSILLRTRAFNPRPEGLAIFLSDSHAHGRTCVREGEILSQPNLTGGQMLCGQLALPDQLSPLNQGSWRQTFPALP